ncbi:MAG: hydrogenase maturation nickel metallochaperone HypA [Gammaproteobacteria bacterium]|nr:hydrogenase maturation nickel metallochaperone HypA [Gammaproteobacteria bacterium]
MHEFAVCQDMLQQIESIVAEQQAAAVDIVTVRIGPLSGIEAHLLSQAFPLAAAGTVAEKAELIIETLPIKVKCQLCGAETEAKPNRLVCGQCGDYHTQLLSGDEMLLASLELLKEPQEAIHV